MAFFRLHGEKADAKAYLDKREYRKRNVIHFATLFALNKDATLREKFKNALAQFPDDLPYEVVRVGASHPLNEQLMATNDDAFVEAISTGKSS